MNNSDKPASPVYNQYMVTLEKGLTKREHFAGLAMQAILPKYTSTDYDLAASCALHAADQLLIELNRVPEIGVDYD